MTLPGTFRAAITLAALLICASPVGAHHGAAGYDYTTVTVSTATIVELQWRNPHTLIRFDITNDDGSVRHWTVEASTPAVLATRGWHRRVLVPGQVVTVHFNKAENGVSFGLLRKLILESGEELWAITPPEKR